MNPIHGQLVLKLSELRDAWTRVLQAFDDWIYYESAEFGPWTSYFSMESLRDLTSRERLGWIYNMRDEVIPGRVEKCRQAGVALEDFMPYMPDPDAMDTVRSMMDLNSIIEHSMLRMSDVFDTMIHEYSEGGLDEIVVSLSTLAETEEDIRNHMSMFSSGFGKLKALGLELPEDLM